MGDDAAGARLCARADFDGCDQQGVRTDERARANDGGMFASPIVVAGDGPRANVGFCAHRGIAQVAEMAHLGAGAEGAVLHLAEVAHVRALAQARPFAQVAEGANLAGFFHHGIF